MTITPSPLRPLALALVIGLAPGSTPGVEAADPLADWRSDEAVPVLPGLVTTEAKEFALSLTPDSRRLFFTRQIEDGETQRLVILESLFVDGSWGEPRVASLSGTWDDADPFVSPGGEWLYFMSKRPTRGQVPREDFELWRAPFEGEALGEPEWLESVGSEAGDSFPTVSLSGELFFASRRDGGSGGNDLWMASPRSGGFSEPVWLGAEVNSEGSDGNPLIAPDGSWLIYFVAGADTAPDLVVSLRAGDGRFQAPSKLCSRVNTRAVEIAPGRSPDGRILFFSRDGEIRAISVSACREELS